MTAIAHLHAKRAGRHNDDNEPSPGQAHGPRILYFSRSLRVRERLPSDLKLLFRVDGVSATTAPTRSRGSALFVPVCISIARGIGAVRLDGLQARAVVPALRLDGRKSRIAVFALTMLLVIDWRIGGGTRTARRVW